MAAGGLGSIDDFVAAYEQAGGATVDRAALRWWPKPTGKRRADDHGGEPETAAQKADRQATTLAALSVAEATDRLALDWTAKLGHQTFYKAVYRPAVLRANRLARESTTAALAGD